MSVKEVSDIEFEQAAEQARLRSIIHVGVKEVRGPNFWLGYKGTLRVVEPDTDWTDSSGNRNQVKGRRYSKTLSVERLSAGDALADAMNMREDIVRVGRLP